MNGTRRILAVLGGAALLALAAFFFLRGKPVEPARAKAGAEARATAGTVTERPSARGGASAAEARRARDAMREQILEALRRRAAADPSKAPGGRATTGGGDEDEPPHGRYDPEYIRANMREDMFPLIKQCYGDALERQPKLAGNLVLKFSIVGDPSVGGVIEDADFADESDIHDDEMRTCVRESLMTLTLDKPPEGGGKVTVTYPIAFSPGDDDAGP